MTSCDPEKTLERDDPPTYARAVNTAAATTTSPSRRVQYLVVDSGAFIKNLPVRELGDNIYTIEGVVSEIRDEATRQRLQVLPYELHLKEPGAEHIKFISDFARRTGDLPSLSPVDLKVLALAYMLETEFNGRRHLRAEPVQRQTRSGSAAAPAGHEILNKSLPGFYNSKENQEDEDPEDTDGATDGDDGWITIENLTDVKKAMAKLNITDDDDGLPHPPDPDRVTVGCVTTDFAMQNVLLQIGLRLISAIDGSTIRETRNYVLRCHACFKITRKMESKFCPKCGNQRTLKRVAVTVNSKGEQVVHINFNRPISLRGTRFSLPRPRSGKHAMNPIVAADQPVPQNRATQFAISEQKAISGGRILTDPDYIARTNPFAINDVYSRSARLGNNRAAGTAAAAATAGRGGLMEPVGRPRNPNAVRQCTGNRKKKRNPL